MTANPDRGIHRINIALQGGGAHGAFTWGVLDRLLEDERIAFEGVSATSAGVGRNMARLGAVGQAKKVVEWLQTEMKVKKIRFPGTSGIGIAIAKEYGRAGAQCLLQQLAHRLQFFCRGLLRVVGPITPGPMPRTVVAECFEPVWNLQIRVTGLNGEPRLFKIKDGVVAVTRRNLLGRVLSCEDWLNIDTRYVGYKHEELYPVESEIMANIRAGYCGVNGQYLLVAPSQP